MKGRQKIKRKKCRDCDSDLNYDGRRELDSVKAIEIKFLNTGGSFHFEGEKLFDIWVCTNPRCNVSWKTEVKYY